MSNKEFLDFKNLKLSSPNKTRALNPNAAEFVPSSFQSLSRNLTNAGSKMLDVPGTSGNVISESPLPNTSNNLVDEDHQYWLQQLPDDITPDFSNEDGLKLPEDLSLSGLSLHDSTETSRYTLSRDMQLPLGMHTISGQGTNVGRLGEFPIFHDMGYNGEYLSLGSMNPSKLWDGSYSIDTELSDGRNFVEGLNVDFTNDIADDTVGQDNASVDPLDFLSSHFPTFASECLADVYYANGCDLNLTIEILTQLELQVDGGFNQNQIPKTPSAPAFSSLDFPSLPVSDVESSLKNHSGIDAQPPSQRSRSLDKENFSFMNYSTSNLRGAQDFASAVRKYNPQETNGYWKPERNGSLDKVVGSSRSSSRQTSSYLAQGKYIFGDKFQNGREGPKWLETGDAVGSLYTESREEARDFARMRNVFYEQARQAYLIGNKALAKELSLKGKWYGMQMAEAHEKARELIYKQRNPVSPQAQSYYRGKELMIDLHGLHVSEAIYVLKHELGVLRKTARSAGQRLQVLICVGTGHHTKGSRTPVRLPVAVEKYLLDERLQYAETQPGLFRVVIF